MYLLLYGSCVTVFTSDNQCSKSGFDWNYDIKCRDCGDGSNVPGMEDDKREYHK